MDAILPVSPGQRLPANQPEQAGAKSFPHHIEQVRNFPFVINTLNPSLYFPGKEPGEEDLPMDASGSPAAGKIIERSPDPDTFSSTEQLKQAMEQLTPAEREHVIKTWLHRHLPLRECRNQRETESLRKSVVHLYFLRASTIKALSIRVKWLAESYKLDPKAVRKSIEAFQHVVRRSVPPAPPTPLQQRELAKHFPTDIRGKKTEVVNWYKRNKRFLREIRFNQRQLWLYAGVTRDSLRITCAEDLPEKQRRILESLRPLSGKHTVAQVAKVWDLHEELLINAGFIKVWVAVAYKVRVLGLYRAIRELRNSPLTDDEKKQLAGFPPEGCGEYQPVVEKILENRGMLRDKGISVFRLAGYFSLRPGTLATKVSLAEQAALSSANRAWLDGEKALKNEQQPLEEFIAGLVVHRKDELDMMGIRQSHLSAYSGIPTCTLSIFISYLRAADLTAEEAQYVEERLPVRDDNQGESRVIMAEVVALYANYSTKDDWPKITSFRLAKHYQVNPAHMQSRLSWLKRARKIAAKRQQAMPMPIMPAAAEEREPEILTEISFVQRAVESKGPILQDALTGRSLTREIMGDPEKIRIIGIRHLPTAVQQQLRAQVIASLISDGVSDRALFRRNFRVFNDPQDPVGNQLLAARDLAEHEYCGLYFGQFLNSAASIEAAMRRDGPTHFLTYVFGTNKGETCVVSGAGNPSILALMNTARYGNFPPRGENNFQFFYIAPENHPGVLAAFVCKKAIKKGEQCLVPYGNSFNDLAIHISHHQSEANEQILQLAGIKAWTIAVIELNGALRICHPSGWLPASTNVAAIRNTTVVVIAARLNKSGELVFDGVPMPVTGWGRGPAYWPRPRNSKAGPLNLYDALARGCSRNKNESASIRSELIGLNIKPDPEIA